MNNIKYNAYSKLTIGNLKLRLKQNSTYWTDKLISEVLKRVDEKYPRNTSYWKRKRKIKILGQLILKEYMPSIKEHTYQI